MGSKKSRGNLIYQQTELKGGDVGMTVTYVQGTFSSLPSIDEILYRVSFCLIVISSFRYNLNDLFIDKWESESHKCGGRGHVSTNKKGRRGMRYV